MSFPSPVKTYVSRGIQTGDDTPPSQFFSLCETQPKASSANNTSNPEPGKDHHGAESSDDFRNQLLGTLAYESAYIQSKGLENSGLLPLLSYKANRYAGVGENRRPLSVSSQKRIVSLPDPPLAPKIEVLTERSTRIVSMPEFKQHTSSDHRAFYQTNSFSTDGSQGRNKSTNSPVRRWHLGHDRNYPSDLPQTPSPPSSPDSVVIIGNETHISGSFLRRSSVDDDGEHYQTPPLDVSDQVLGWVTWANSPPRPIPALHGPLSLPYARCPSGAEGTVIEGDDLTHKIWGLGAGDSHIQTAPHTGRSQTHQPPRLPSSGIDYNVASLQPIKEPHQDVQSSTTLQRQRDSVIDLSMPLTFYNGNGPISNTFNPLNVNLFGNGLFPASRETQNRPPDGLRIDRGATPHRDSRGWVANTVDLAKSYPFNPLESMDDGWKRSIISDPRIDKDTRSFGGNGQNRLNKSAPVFIPGSDWQAKDNIQYERDGAFPVDARQLRQIDLPQSRLNEFSSPSTSSPNWSPMFPHLVDGQMSNLATPRHIQDTILYADPKIYSPSVESEDYSTKLMAMIQQFKNQELLSIAKRCPGPPRAAKPQAGEFPAGRKGPPAVGRVEQNQAVDMSGPIHVPSDFRRDLAHQHPRSIPLARLIQRRLSSVPEEVGTGNNSLSPSEAKFSKEFLSPEPYRVLRQDVKLPAGIRQGEDAQQTAETMEGQAEYGASNAVVRLPRKSSSPPGLARSSSGPAECRRPLRDENKTDKRSPMTSENKGATGMGLSKGRTSKGKAKKKEGDPAKDVSE